MHSMTAEICHDQARLVFTCRQCDRCIAISTVDGRLRVIHPGEQRIAHSGGVFGPELQAEAEQDAPARPDWMGERC